MHFQNLLKTARRGLFAACATIAPGARIVARCTALGALTVSVSGFECCDFSGALMRSYGYTQVKPPSNLMMPGSIVAVSHRRPFTAALVCGPRASLGSNWAAQESPTADAMTQKMNGRNLKIEANMLESIKMDARFSSIASVTMQISRARIVELRDEDVIQGVAHRSEACQTGIRERLRRGFKITMISSALSGDVTYKVRFQTQASLDARAKLDCLDQLAVELGGGATSVSATEIRAVDLVWGVRDDAYLSSIGVPDELMPAPAPATRIIPNERTANILPIPDAPVVNEMDRRPSMEGYDEDSANLIRYYRQPSRRPVDGAPIFDPRHRPTAEPSYLTRQRSRSM